MCVNLTSYHLFLFAKLHILGRISIRENNPDLTTWHDLKALGFCSILGAGRAGTVVIHQTMKADGLAESFIDMMGELLNETKTE